MICPEPPITLQRLQAAFWGHSPHELSAEDGTRWASVAAIFRHLEGRPEVLFIERAKHEADPWSGHMAFPGGRADDGDPALVSTAVREVEEELGLSLVERGQVLGQLSDIPAIGRGKRMPLYIRPYLFYLAEEALLSPNHEVAKVIWVPLSFLRAEANLTTFTYPYRGDDLQMPCYKYEGHVIWGLTFNMVQSMVEVLALLDAGHSKGTL